MKRLAIAGVLIIGMAFLASGCLWGEATGSPEPSPPQHFFVEWWSVRELDGKVTYSWTETNDYGFYIFPRLPPYEAMNQVPWPGDVTFRVWSADCPETVETRWMQFDDCPDAMYEDERCERQDFQLSCPPKLQPPSPAPPQPPPTATPGRITLVPPPVPTGTPIPLPR